MSDLAKLVEYFSDSAKAATEPMPTPWLAAALSLPLLIIAALGMWWFLRRAYQNRVSIEHRIGLGEGLIGAVATIVVISVIVTGVKAGMISDQAAHALALEKKDLAAYSLEHATGALSALMAIVLLLVGIFIYSRTRPKGRLAIEVPLPSQSDLWLVLVVAAWWMLMFGMGFFNSALVAIFDPSFLPVEQEVVSGYQVSTQWQVAAAVLGAAILAPVSEEILCRLFLFGGLRSRLPFWLAASVSSLLFLLLHEPWKTPNLILPIFGLGFALAWIYEKSRSIWYPIAFHAMHNALTLAALGVFS